MDAAGRLLIPKDLIRFCRNKERDSDFVSLINIVEIWDKNKYEQAINEAANRFRRIWLKKLWVDESDYR